MQFFGVSAHAYQQTGSHRFRYAFGIQCVLPCTMDTGCVGVRRNYNAGRNHLKMLSISSKMYSMYKLNSWIGPLIRNTMRFRIYYMQAINESVPWKSLFKCTKCIRSARCRMFPASHACESGLWHGAGGSFSPGAVIEQPSVRPSVKTRLWNRSVRFSGC